MEKPDRRDFLETVVTFQIGEMTKFTDRAVSGGFEIPIILRIRGEQSLYFDVQDVDLVFFTRCCHQDIVTFADYAPRNLNGQGKIHGLYGGLHIAPFGKLGYQKSGWIEKMGSYAFKRIAANRCASLPAGQKLIELDYPMVRGTDPKGSQGSLYIGNGDSVVFG
jgi:7,8-dihydropterin-6-yl-methyl-4-(beta-D-ribofuranosyl)aminobenzene 5'-phosphate synthase